MSRADDGYPLNAVETMRERAETSATEALAAALRELGPLEKARAEALSELAAHRQREARRLLKHAGESQARLPQTTAAIWAREQAYRTRQREDEEALQEALEAATDAERQGRAIVAEARKALGGAAQERAVVAAHRARWQGGVDREKAKQEEDEQDEWVRSR